MKLRTETDRANILHLISNVNLDKPKIVEIKDHEEKRSLDQNAIGHVWYNQISKELKEQTPLEVKCECKLTIGVPILRAENEDFRKMYDAAIRGNLTYEEKLEVMKYLPVTSLMSVKQKSRYLEHVQQTYARRGVILEFPEDEAYRPENMIGVNC